MKKLFLLTVFFGVFMAKAQTIVFPDPNFKARLLASSPDAEIAYGINLSRIAVDTNNDGEIQVSEASQVLSLDLHNSNISDLTGIANFVNVQGVYCSYNQLATLDVSALSNLRSLICSNNLLTAITFPPQSILFELECANNQLTTLNYTSAPQGALETITANGNPFTSVVLNLEQGTYNNFYVNVSSTVPMSLECHFPPDNINTNIGFMLDTTITNLNLTGRFDVVNFNALVMENLDLSQAKINTLFFTSQTLKQINLKNGHYTQNLFNTEGVPNLEYICADEDEIASFENQFSGTGVVVNSYCSFNPGGAFYEIAGRAAYDEDNNGCNASDANFPYIKYSITNGLATTILTSDASGNYRIPVQAGTHTITPLFEYPAYFNASPSVMTAVFPAQPSPFIQNICVTANGNHPDVEVVIVPMSIARPGFDARYKLIYTNKGNAAQSGIITFVYENSVVFVSGLPTATGQNSNSASWNFTDLQPFESREILITMNINSPLETPPVNNQDVLTYLAAINTEMNDETPNDNNFYLHETVVNSLDPNDKTCLEGEIVDASLIGKYVHYKIRFENTGTASAVNIVVKDVIDTEKFEVQSLIPLDGSHEFYTRINGNQVEFIFENIELPFDDAHNDGYVLFKIKTKPSLAVGSSFSNSAGIYFDYNAPVITNTATSTFALLQTVDFEFSDQFALHPNPAQDVLNIHAKHNAVISSIEVYNTLGQLVVAVTNAQSVSKIDVSQLSSGNYFIRINSDKGTTNAKFAKN